MIDLVAKRDELVIKCKQELAEISQRFGEHAIKFLTEETVVDIHFPVDFYPVKVKSFNFDKYPEVSGVIKEDEFLALFEYATNNKHDALIIDQTSKNMFKLNWDIGLKLSYIEEAKSLLNT